MSTIANLLIRIGVDSRAAEAGMARTGKSAALLKRSFVPAIAVLGGLGLAAQGGARSLQRIELIGSQTNAVIKSTGGAANVTRGQIDALAGSIEDATGVEAESVTEGQNLLLTFMNIKNGVGESGDIFDRTTRAMVDMSAAMGTDAKSSAILLGKALNNPSKGAMALSRTGSLARDDLEKLQNMAKAGVPVWKQQEFILKALEQQYGGTAVAAGNTAAGGVKKLGHQVGTLQEELTVGLMPAFTAVVGVLRMVTGVLLAHKTATKVAVGVIAALAVGVIAAHTAVTLYAAGTTLATGVVKAMVVTTKLWTAAQWLLNGALAGNPLALVILAVIGLAAAIVVAWRNSATFRAVVTGAFDAVRSAAMAVFNWVKANWPLLLVMLTGPIGLAVLAIIKHWDKVQAAVDAVKAVIGSIVGAVQRVAGSSALASVGAAFGTAFGAARTAVQGVSTAVSALISAVQTAISLVASLSGNSARAHAQARALQGNGGAGGGIPATANGGIFNGAQVRLIGEAGPEAVIPLNRPRRAAELMEQAGLTGGGGPRIHIDTMVVQDATDIDRVAARLGRQMRMAG